MSEKVARSLDQIKILLLIGVVVLSTQLVKTRGSMELGTACMGMLALIAIAFVSLKIKEALPWKIPAFAWASLLALLMTTPWSPVAELLLKIASPIGTTQIGTVILAIAGVSIGTKLNDLKKLSWKMVIVAVVVFLGTFFGSALISQIILKLQGII